MTWVRLEGNIIALVNQVLIPLLLWPAPSGSSSSTTTTSDMGFSAGIMASSAMAPTVTVDGRDVTIFPITTVGISSGLHVILTLMHGVSKVILKALSISKNDVLASIQNTRGGTL